jgi:hypothetical protein
VIRAGRFISGKFLCSAGHPAHLGQRDASFDRYGSPHGVS